MAASPDGGPAQATSFRRPNPAPSSLLLNNSIPARRKASSILARTPTLLVPADGGTLLGLR